MSHLSAGKLILEQLTFLPVPTFLSANVHVPLAVTVSPLCTPLKVIVHDAVVFPLYSLLLHELTLGVTDFLPIVSVPVLYVIE